MICTIFESNGRKELHYGEQQHAWAKWLVYQVSEKCIDLIRTCKIEEIQQVITHIEEVSPRVWSTNSI